MKKCILFIPVLCLAILLSGCGTAGDTESYSKTDSAEVEEMNIENGEESIYGRLYKPQNAADDTLVIMSHGFGGTYRNVEDYAEDFAGSGITAFAFDFSGGGTAGRSDGSTTEMSVLTEADDLNTVIDYFIGNAGYEKIYLLGESQGGFVSTYVAGTRPEDINGLIVFYPAYVLQDYSRERNPDPENGPDTSSLMGVQIGKIYDTDAQSFDIYDIMAGYTGKVQIVHGTSDTIVPISYSERAAETFPNAQLVTIEGAGHGFYGDAQEQASELAIQFVLESGGGQEGSTKTQ